MNSPETHRGPRAARLLTRPTAFLSAALAVVAVLAAACGDGSAEALSKQDYISQANAICAETNAVAEAEWEKFFETIFADTAGEQETPEQAQTMFEAMDTMFDGVITPNFDEQLSDLRALGEPDGDGEVLAALYDDLEDALDDYNATLDDAVAGDETAMEGIGSGTAEEVFDDVNQRALDYGLSVCGEGTE